MKKYKIIINFKNGTRAKAKGTLKCVNECLEMWKEIDKEKHNMVNYEIMEM